MSRRRWTASRLVSLGVLVLVNVSVATGVYSYLGAHRGTFTLAARRPGEAGQENGPLSRLPGTIFLSQGGTLYRLQHGTFTPVLNGGGSTQWVQPAFTPSGQSVAVVKREYQDSDIFVVDLAGHVQAQLTHDQSGVVENNHWAFFPRPAGDGSTVFFSYDIKDRFNSYNVVLSVESMPLSGAGPARRWTIPNNYTGGDVQPVPLPSGGLIYTKYAFDPQTSRLHAQLWLTTRAVSAGRALTPPEDDCSQPSLSPDGRRLAMICTGGKQVANVEVAAFDGSGLGQRVVVVAGQQASQPAWAPDSSGFVYLAPVGLAGHFQLWWQQVPRVEPAPTPPPTPTPSVSRRSAVRKPTPTPTPPATPASPTPTPTPIPAPAQLTSNLDFDASSTIAWH